MRELPFRVTQYFPPGWILPAQLSRGESLSLSALSYHDQKFLFTHMLVTKRLELLLKVIDGVENGRVLLEEVAERLGESLGLKLLNLAQATSLTSLQVPIDLTNLPRRKLGDTRCAGAVVSCVAALHIRQDEALGAFLVLDRCRRRRIVIVEHS